MTTRESYQPAFMILPAIRAGGAFSTPEAYLQSDKHRIAAMTDDYAPNIANLPIATDDPTARLDPRYPLPRPLRPTSVNARRAAWAQAARLPAPLRLQAASALASFCALLRLAFPHPETVIFVF